MFSDRIVSSGKVHKLWLNIISLMRNLLLGRHPVYRVYGEIATRQISVLDSLYYPSASLIDENKIGFFFMMEKVN